MLRAQVKSEVLPFGPKRPTQLSFPAQSIISRSHKSATGTQSNRETNKREENNIMASGRRVSLSPLSQAQEHLSVICHQRTCVGIHLCCNGFKVCLHSGLYGLQLGCYLLHQSMRIRGLRTGSSIGRQFGLAGSPRSLRRRERFKELVLITTSNAVESVPLWGSC